ncbi:hypothetical protein V7056_08920 [Bacillus sp. JJ664]
MTVLNKLATTLERRDEEPNIELAIQISEENDISGIKELVENLSNKSKDIQNDCIKVLYEIGERKPTLLIEYTNEFLHLLSSKNNRLQWGVMTALSSIVLEIPQTIFNALPTILSAGEKGSVITKDQVVNILIKLCSIEEYKERAFEYLIQQLQTSPTNQLPMYAERAMPIIDQQNKQIFIMALNARMNEIEKETKRKRVEKVINKLG